MAKFLQPIFFLLIILLAGKASGQGEKFDDAWKLLALKGKVKMMIIKKYQAITGPGGEVRAASLIPMISGTIVNNGDMQNLLRFNKLGQLVESHYAPYSDSSVFYKTYYLYNGSNKISEVRVEHKSLALISSTKKVFQYDNSGKMIRMTEYYGNSDTTAWWEYSYSLNGSKLYAGLFLKKFGYSNTLVYEYDSIGRITHITLYNKKDSIHTVSRRPIGVNDMIYEIKNTKAETALGNFIKYEYDEFHNWVRQVKYRRFKAQYIIVREITYY